MSYILHNVTNDAYLSANTNGIGPLFLKVSAAKNEDLLTYADKDAAYDFTKFTDAKFFMTDLAKIGPKKHYLMICCWSNLPVFEIEDGIEYYYQDGSRRV